MVAITRARNGLPGGVMELARMWNSRAHNTWQMYAVLKEVGSEMAKTVNGQHVRLLDQLVSSWR